MQTSKGTVQIEFADEAAARQCTVKIDGDEVRIENLGQPLAIRPGKHTLRVAQGELEIETREFTVLRGGKEVIRISTPALAADTRISTPSRPSGEPPLAVAPFDAKKAKEHQENWAKHLGVPVEMTNSIGMELALIPAGEFWMGSTPEEIAWAIQRRRDYTEHARSHPIGVSATPRANHSAVLRGHL